MKVNWAMYVHTMPTSLCVGEERTLTDAEITEINKLVGDIFQDSCRLEELFKCGKDRFANPPKPEEPKPVTTITLKDGTALSLDKVVSAYSGKDGECCCGCKGKHYHRQDRGDYRGGGTKNDIRNIKRIFDAVAGAAKVEVDDTFVSTVINERIYIVYLS